LWRDRRRRFATRELDVLLMQLSNLPARVLEVAAVVDDLVRRAQASRSIRLCRDRRGRFRARHAVAPHQPVELQCVGAIDDRDAVDELAEVPLDELARDQR
jgi:hypothetical protein